MRQDESDVDSRREARCIVIAHISGASGVGKTTTMRRIKSKFPHIITLDLDCLDNYSKRKAGFPADWKSHMWSRERIQQAHYHRQRALDRLIENCIRLDKRVLLFGIHTEDVTEYYFETPVRVFLVRPVCDIVDSRLKRDIKWFYRQGKEGAMVNWIDHLKRLYEEQTLSIERELRDKGYHAVPISCIDNFIRKVCNE